MAGCAGGVTRMTVSITVLVMEATGGLQVCRQHATSRINAP
jgi:H+/Cl- antiporter ClcA